MLSKTGPESLQKAVKSEQLCWRFALVMLEQSKFALCSTEALDGACFVLHTDLAHTLRQSRSAKRKQHF